MLLVIPCFEGPHIYLTGGIFTTVTGSSASMLSFVNSTTGRWSAPYFTNSECAVKDNSVDAFTTPLSLHNSVVFLYFETMLYSHTILSGR